MSIFRSINAVTLATKNMKSSVDFYSKLGLTVSFGGESAKFTTMSPEKVVTKDNNRLHINLFHDDNFKPPDKPGTWNGWGRYIIFVGDVDEIYETAVVKNGLKSDTGPPKDAPWGERYFHMRDPMGHELSVATPDYSHARWDNSGWKEGSDGHDDVHPYKEGSKM